MQLIVAYSPINAHLNMNELPSTGQNFTALRAFPQNQKDDAARKDQDRFMVLTTVKCYSDFIKAFEYKEYSPRAGIVRKVETLQKEKGLMLNWKKGGVKVALNFGIGVADECHESMLKDKGRPGILARLPGKPFCWGLSGTPCDNSPRGIEGMLWAMESQAEKEVPLALETGWEQDDELRQFQWAALDSVAKQFQKLVQQPSPKSKEVDDVLSLFKPFLESFVIRREGEHSQWFGHPLSRLNPHTHRDIYLEHNPAHDAQVKLFSDKLEGMYEEELNNVRKVADMDKHLKGDPPQVLKWDAKMRVATDLHLRLFATVPYLAKLGTLPFYLKFLPNELAALRQAKKNIYAEHLDNIIATSPKLLWLRDVIRRLDETKDVDGNEQKLVILTSFPHLAFIIKLVSSKWSLEWKLLFANFSDD